MSEGAQPTDNPFVDPSIHENEGVLEGGESTLFVTQDASLTLGADSLIVLGTPCPCFLRDNNSLTYNR